MPDTAGSGGEWQFPIFAQSLPIDYNNSTITQARMTVTTVSLSGSMELYLSANGGTNWEQVSNGSTHAFTNTGTSLCWRIVVIGTGIVSKIVIDQYQ